jgi:hypothetical protein
VQEGRWQDAVERKPEIEHTAAEHRLASRRAEQATDAFREHYAIRGGGESVNAGLKRKTGMGRLRVRGSPRVRMVVLLRCAGWNLFRALAAMKKRGIAGFGAFFGDWTLIRTLVRRLRRWIDAPDGFAPHQTAPGRESPTLAAA